MSATNEHTRDESFHEREARVEWENHRWFGIHVMDEENIKEELDGVMSKYKPQDAEISYEDYKTRHKLSTGGWCTHCDWWQCNVENEEVFFNKLHRQEEGHDLNDEVKFDFDEVCNPFTM